MTQTEDSRAGARPARMIRAAQYVRMSTEHQKYSTENQAEIIARYAAQRGFEIVETYLEKVCAKLRVRTRIEAVVIAVRVGLITPDPR